jgi:hypothetical protein
MPELKITVVLPGQASEVEAERLDGLMSALAAEAGRAAILQREHGLGRAEGPPRVFIGTFSTPEALAAILRGCGGWYMRNPTATVTFKIQSSKGGKTLQMSSYSAVAVARAAAQLEEYLE